MTYAFFINQMVRDEDRTVSASLETRTTVQAVVEGLGYDFDRFEVEDFQHHIAKRRERPLSIRYVALAPELFGFWYPTANTDYIAVNSNLHPAHRIHTLLHELAHMLLGHRGTDLRKLLGEDIIHQLGIGAGEGHLRSIATIDQANDRQEQEAEEFVLLIRRKLVTAHRLQELYGEPTSIDSLRPYVRGLDFNS
jgi:hypothetical protein